MKPFVIISGMHRSGTSFLVRALNLHGLYLGDLDSLISHEWKPRKDNPKGHWENKQILELAEKTLSDNNGIWDKPPKKIIFDKKIGEKIKECTSKLIDNSILAGGFKDPRLILYFDEWKKFLPENFVIIGIIRHPLKVAESLKKRNGFSYEKSLNLWEIYNQKLIDILTKNDGFLLDFDWPKEKLFAEIEFISKKIGLVKKIDISDWYSNKLLKSDKTYQTNYKLSPEIKYLYSNLKKLSHKNKIVKIRKIKAISKKLSSKVEEFLTSIHKQEKVFTKIFDESIKLQKEFDECSKWASELNQKLENMQPIIQTKDSQILNLQNEIEKFQAELLEIKNSVMYGITSGIARKIDKLAPESTRRRNALKMSSAAYLMKKEKGTKAVLNVVRETMSKSIIKHKKKSQTNPKAYLKTIKEKKSKIISNVINVEEKLEPDNSLRRFIEFGAHNITNLSKFPKISIIITTYNQVDALKRNLASIESKSTFQNYELSIVTNNHDENSEMRQFLKTIKHPVHVFEEEYSFGAMNNFGSKKSNGKFLLFLNDDVEVLNPNWLEAFLSLGLKESVGVVGPKMLSSNRKLQDCGGIVWANGNAWNYGRFHDSEDPIFNYVRDVDYISGSCLFVKKEIFEKVGGFDRRFDPAYWEDADLCFSIRNLGYEILYQPLANLVHYEGLTQGISTESGLKSYQIPNQKKFEEKWKSVLETHLNDSTENSFFERNRKHGLNILYIDHYVPEPDKDSGSLRTFRILSILSHMNNKVTFWPENQKIVQPYVSELQQKGIEVIYKIKDFNRFLEERKNLYDIAILARPYISVKFIDSIKEKIPNCKIIYDTIDLHFLRMNREAALENNEKNSEAEMMRQLEFSMMKKSDITILTSPSEIKFLHDEDPSLKIAIVPNIHTESHSIVDFDGRKNMMFLGGFIHGPNIDAVKYLVHDIWPKIKNKLPETKLYIVGSNPTNEIKQLASEDIIVTGYVKDLTPYYNECKLMLAPLRFGSGVKGKLTQSLARGLPIISTTIAAEGINLIDGKNCMISDDSNEFVSKVIEVYTNEKLWQDLSQNGINLAKDYSPERIRVCFETIFSSIL